MDKNESALNPKAGFLVLGKGNIYNDRGVCMCVGDGGVGYLESPWSSAAFLAGGRGSCLGLRTGVSPHFSTNSMREILTLY